MKISIESVLTDKAIEALYPTYVAAFEPLLTKAAARHVLTAEEFAKEMNDPRIDKYLVRDDVGQAVALTTVSSDLSVIDWINAHYYTARYPDVAARGALFYLGYTLVDRTRRRSVALQLMAGELNRRVAEVQGVVGFDICQYNVTHGIGRQPAHLLRSCRQIETLDTQTYYAADFREPSESDGDAGEAATDGGRTGGPDHSFTVVTGGDRPDLVEQVMGLLAARWPAFMLAGESGHGEDLPGLLMSRPADQVLLVDSDDRVQGAGLSIPLRWDGTRADLPGGWDDAIRRSLQQQRDGVPTNTTCALSITVGAAAAGRNCAVELIRGLKDVARRAGSRALVAPIRPILKAQYPLVDLAGYLTWRTADGRPFDPWVRLHLREGGELLGIAAESMTISGALEDWERWAEVTLPGSGAFVIEGGLAPLVVDAEAGIGVYREPNAWVAHQLSV